MLRLEYRHFNITNGNENSFGFFRFARLDKALTSLKLGLPSQTVRADSPLDRLSSSSLRCPRCLSLAKMTINL